jgi:hypothetical protein
VTRGEDGLGWDVTEEAAGETVDADGISLANED